MRAFYISLIVLALVAQYPDIATATADVESFRPQDCTTLPKLQGPCVPRSCLRNCQSNLGPGAVGQCVPGGCQCTYCAK
ncbi:hypothetical protein EJB05_44481 [Eragrostis curvula]|uniref:Knottin scorpion toxin-like domain-containing protein n=1 Tax=Eragrostis curvula TaxID=38414 RepID=A0A5J9THN6_9POAL|nr:hypothetical protein EJB05_44481 [Eragrostis curvula]